MAAVDVEAVTAIEVEAAAVARVVKETSFSLFVAVVVAQTVNSAGN